MKFRYAFLIFAYLSKYIYILRVYLTTITRLVHVIPLWIFTGLLSRRYTCIYYYAYNTILYYYNVPAVYAHTHNITFGITEDLNLIHAHLWPQF